MREFLAVFLLAFSPHVQNRIAHKNSALDLRTEASLWRRTSGGPPWMLSMASTSKRSGMSFTWRSAGKRRAVRATTCCFSVTLTSGNAVSCALPRTPVFHHRSQSNPLHLSRRPDDSFARRKRSHAFAKTNRQRSRRECPSAAFACASWNQRFHFRHAVRGATSSG